MLSCLIFSFRPAFFLFARDLDPTSRSPQFLFALGAHSACFLQADPALQQASLFAYLAHKLPTKATALALPKRAASSSTNSSLICRLPDSLPSQKTELSQLPHKPSSQTSLTPEGKKQALALALYAEALRIENEKQDPQAALASYQKIIALDPSFIQAHLKIASSYLQQDHNTQALKHLNQALKNNPGSLDLQSAKAYTLARLGQHQQALSLAQQALQDNPNDLIAYRTLIEINLQQSNQEAIHLYFQKALEQNRPTKSPFWIGLAQLYQQSLARLKIHNPETIANHLLPFYKKAEQVGPASSEIYSRLADYHSTLGHSKQAIAFAQQAIGLGPPRAELYLRLTLFFLNDQQPKNALKACEKAYQMNPQDKVVRKRLVHLYLQEKTPEKTVVLLEKMIQTPPHQKELYHHLAQLYIEKKELKKAIHILEQALEHFPQNIPWAIQITQHYQTLGDLPHAIKTLEQAIRHHPTNSQLYLFIGELYEHNKQYPQAEAHFQQAVHLEPTLPLPLLRLAYTQLLQHQKIQAAKTLTQARHLFPTSAHVALLEAILARQNKEYQQALSNLEQMKALALDEQAHLLNEAYFIELSLNQELLGDIDDAERTLQKALRNFPQSSELKNTLAYLWAEHGLHLDQALHLSQESLSQQPTNGAYLDTLGWIYFKKHQPQKALPLLQKAMLATDNDPVVLEHLADTLAQLGRLESAIRIWQQLIDQNPKNEKIRQQLQKALAQSKPISEPAAHKNP